MLTENLSKKDLQSSKKRSLQRHELWMSKLKIKVLCMGDNSWKEVNSDSVNLPENVDQYEFPWIIKFSKLKELCTFPFTIKTFMLLMKIRKRFGKNSGCVCI